MLIYFWNKISARGLKIKMECSNSIASYHHHYCWVSRQCVPDTPLTTSERLKENNLPKVAWLWSDWVRIWTQICSTPKSIHSAPKWHLHLIYGHLHQSGQCALKYQGTWEAQSVKCLTLCFSSRLISGSREWAPMGGSFSPFPSPHHHTCSLSLSFR